VAKRLADGDEKAPIPVPGPAASTASKPSDRNFPLAYLLMGLPGSLANVPTSRREHAIL